MLCLLYFPGFPILFYFLLHAHWKKPEENGGPICQISENSLSRNKKWDVIVIRIKYLIFNLGPGQARARFQILSGNLWEIYFFILFFLTKVNNFSFW